MFIKNIVGINTYIPYIHRTPKTNTNEQFKR